MSKYAPGDKIAVSARVIQPFTNKRTGAPSLTILINETQLTISEDAVLQEALEKPLIKKGDIVFALDAPPPRDPSKPQYKVICVEDDHAMCRGLIGTRPFRLFPVNTLVRIEE